MKAVGVKLIEGFGGVRDTKRNRQNRSQIFLSLNINHFHVFEGDPYSTSCSQYCTETTPGASVKLFHSPRFFLSYLFDAFVFKALSRISTRNIFFRRF